MDKDNTHNTKVQCLKMHCMRLTDSVQQSSSDLVFVTQIGVAQLFYDLARVIDWNGVSITLKWT